MSDNTSVMMLQQFTLSPKKSRQCANEIGISNSSVQFTQMDKWKCCVPRLLHSMAVDDSGHSFLFCEWTAKKQGEDAQFVGTTVWTDEVTFNL